MREKIVVGSGITGNDKEKISFLKGQCHEIFDPRFFSLKHPSRAPD
jgi:hypothetical protein